ncbi:hypothetical protein Egran_06770 [Elaphomyces granulatus]|uniref:RRM domain-containing protein n=1 Tax=Elaphomyces granulatus TaxID=519963 RepID=A0A232LMS3_9EURO|nr:hypothetical protein Egran_06770 [Elaphomyces granulatus]
MADTLESGQDERHQQRWVSTKPFSHHGASYRLSGRAFNSQNWRIKADDSSNAPSSPLRPQMDSPRPALGKQSSQVPQAIIEGRRLYVGNMPYMAKKKDVHELFAAGEFNIEQIDISIDPFTGRNPSYCFVELETKEQAEQAMQQLGGRDFLGRPVKIRPGVAKSPTDRSIAKTDGSPRTESERPFAFDRWQRDDASAHFKGYSEQGRRLYVGGLPKLSNQANIDTGIRKFFRGFNVEAVSKLISPPPSKLMGPDNHYYLFVDFPSSKEAQSVIDALDGEKGPWGGKIRIYRARGDSWKPDERQKWGAVRENDLSTTAKTNSAA